MNDHDLQQKLAALAAPPATDTARERARHRALIALQEGGREPVPEGRRRFLPWALAALAALVLAAAIFWPRTAQLTHAPGDTAVLAQVEALFPGQLDAVIEEGGAVRLALASAPHRASDQPVLVEFRRGDATVRVLSYSGRHVCVDLGGQHACFEAFMGERGRVIVAGDNFVWTAQDHATAGDWEISAVALEGAS